MNLMDRCRQRSASEMVDASFQMGWKGAQAHIEPRILVPTATSQPELA